MPDDELLRAADEGRLATTEAVDAQVRRMLRDPKSFALVENFGGQWLQFRALESHTVERKAFQGYTDYTRMSMQRETEEFFRYIMREDRSVVDLVLENAKALQRRLGRADQQRLDEYLTGIRSVEQRIDAVEAKRKLDLLDERNPGPSNIVLDDKLTDEKNRYLWRNTDPVRRDPERHAEYISLMSDLMVLAFQTDSTRISTFLVRNMAAAPTGGRRAVMTRTRDGRGTYGCVGPGDADTGVCR